MGRGNPQPQSNKENAVQKLDDLLVKPMSQGHKKLKLKKPAKKENKRTIKIGVAVAIMFQTDKKS